LSKHFLNNSSENTQEFHPALRDFSALFPRLFLFREPFLIPTKQCVAIFSEVNCTAALNAQTCLQSPSHPQPVERSAG